MATKAQNIESIERALGEPWSTTRQRLEKAGGKDASHKELADALYPQFDGVVDNHGWWVQGAVVAYEQEIGRRVPGQRADGTFDVAVSRTVNGERGDVIDRVAALVDGELGGVALDGDPRVSTTPKRSYWRANLVDGTKVEAAAEPKDDDRTLLALTASKLPSAEVLEQWRAELKDFIGQV